MQTLTPRNETAALQAERLETHKDLCYIELKLLQIAHKVSAMESFLRGSLHGKDYEELCAMCEDCDDMLKDACRSVASKINTTTERFLNE